MFLTTFWFSGPHYYSTNHSTPPSFNAFCIQPSPPTYLPTQHQHTDNIQFKFAPPRLIRPLHLLFYFLAAGLSSPLALNPSSPSQTSAVNFPREDLENCQFETQLRSVVPSTNNSSSFTAAEISPTCRDWKHYKSVKIKTIWAFCVSNKKIVHIFRENSDQETGGN